MAKRARRLKIRLDRIREAAGVSRDQWADIHQVKPKTVDRWEVSGATRNILGYYRLLHRAKELGMVDQALLLIRPGIDIDLSEESTPAYGKALQASLASEKNRDASSSS